MSLTRLSRNRVAPLIRESSATLAASRVNGAFRGYANSVRPQALPVLWGFTDTHGSLKGRSPDAAEANAPYSNTKTLMIAEPREIMKAGDPTFLRGTP